MMPSSRYKYGYNKRISIMPRKTIVPCSGGLDSVGLIWKLLHDTDEEILVQHVKMDCYHKHWKAEEEAFLKCMDYIKEHCREFEILPTIEYGVVSPPVSCAAVEVPHPAVIV